MAKTWVSTEEISRILAGTGNLPLTRTSLGRFVQDGMPAPKNGRYDPAACVGWYLAKLRAAVRRKETEGDAGATSNLEDERKRLTAAQADRLEMELAQLRGDLIPISFYESSLTNLVLVTKQRILNVPTRIAAKLEGCSTIEIKSLMNASLRDALMELSRAMASTLKKKVERELAGKHTRKPASK